MMVLKDRYEIAEAINIDLLPVLTVDMANCADGYERCYKGDDVRVKYRTRKGDELWVEGELWYEDGEYSIIGGGFGIKDRFSYEDMMEIARTAKTPMLEEGQEVVVITHSSTGRCFTAVKMTVSDVNPYRITKARLI